MANDTVITVIGNLTGDPELRYTQSGVAVANFTVASTPRHYDKNKQEWVEDEALFLRCSVWREYAEHVAESLLRQRGWEDKEGNKRTSYELDVDEVAPSLRWATAKVQKMQRQSQGQTDGSAWDTPNAVPNQDSEIPF
jgi:single-strand DNA-binding protein